MKNLFFLTIMTLALFGNMQAQTLTPKVVTLGNLRVYPTDLGYFPAVPDSVIAAINQKTSYGYDNWRVPTAKEMALMIENWDKIPGLTNKTYMTSDWQRSGNLRLVSTVKILAEKEQEKTRKPPKPEPPIGHRPPKGQEPDGQKRQAEEQKPDGQKQQAEGQKPDGQKRQPEGKKPDGQKQPPKGQKPDGQKQQAEEQKPDGQKQQAEEQKPDGQKRQTEGKKPDGQKQPPKGQKPDGQKQQAEEQKADGQKGKTPPHAASAKTWVIGDQTWSDAIRIPECNKASFIKSETEPDCRSYTEGGNTWYYYNWEYVSRYAAKLCPSPWRMPTKEDFDILTENKSTGFPDIWGYGGRANASAMENVSVHGNYWSSTENSSQTGNQMYYGSSGIFVGRFIKFYGDQVRCVK
jgi:hypothetical protein